MAQELTPAAADTIVVSLLNPSGAPAGAAHLVAKLDHLVHGLRVSGHLSELSADQVKNIIWALHDAGHLRSASPVAPEGVSPTYDQDGLISIHNADFLEEPRFVAAYARGIAAAGCDYNFRWRVHVGLWAASHASKLAGDFVECGVNRGFMSSAMMQYLDWNQLSRRFFLLDTFRGLDERFIADEEKAIGRSAASFGYAECFEEARKNFAEFHNVFLIRGPIPLTLPDVDSEQVCYLHLDMNCAPPEVAALEYFWEKLVPGAVVLLDDYGAPGHGFQKTSMDRVARERGQQILTLPTCQGLLIKE
jgi:hypothetical protein